MKKIAFIILAAIVVFFGFVAGTQFYEYMAGDEYVYDRIVNPPQKKDCRIVEPGDPLRNLK